MKALERAGFKKGKQSYVEDFDGWEKKAPDTFVNGDGESGSWATILKVYSAWAQNHGDGCGGEPAKYEVYYKENDLGDPKSAILYRGFSLKKAIAAYDKAIEMELAEAMKKYKVKYVVETVVSRSRGREIVQRETKEAVVESWSYVAAQELVCEQLHCDPKDVAVVVEPRVKKPRRY